MHEAIASPLVSQLSRSSFLTQVPRQGESLKKRPDKHFDIKKGKA